MDKTIINKNTAFGNKKHPAQENWAGRFQGAPVLFDLEDFDRKRPGGGIYLDMIADFFTEESFP